MTVSRPSEPRSNLTTSPSPMRVRPSAPDLLGEQGDLGAGGRDGRGVGVLALEEGVFPRGCGEETMASVWAQAQAANMATRMPARTAVMTRTQ